MAGERRTDAVKLHAMGTLRDTGPQTPGFCPGASWHSRKGQQEALAIRCVRLSASPFMVKIWGKQKGERVRCKQENPVPASHHAASVWAYARDHSCSCGEVCAAHQPIGYLITASQPKFTAERGYI